MPLPQDIHGLLQKLQGLNMTTSHQDFWKIDGPELGVHEAGEAHPEKEKADSFLEISKMVVIL